MPLGKKNRPSHRMEGGILESSASKKEVGVNSKQRTEHELLL